MRLPRLVRPMDDSDDLLAAELVRRYVIMTVLLAVAIAAAAVAMGWP